MKAFAKMMRVVGTALLAKHGQAISEKGLDAVGLQSCAEVSRLLYAQKMTRNEEICLCFEILFMGH